MNAELLLEHFHRLGDAPDAVPRLRRFLLGLALDGAFLTDSDKEQWPLKPLGLLCEFKGGLWTGKKPPFASAKVLRVTNITKDCEMNVENAIELDVEVKQLSTRTLQPGDILIEKSGGGDNQPVGRVALFSEQDGIYSFSNFTTVMRILDREEVFPDYLHDYLRSFYFRGGTLPLQNNATNLRNLQLEDYKQVLVPLPPLPEQHRIVAKVEELMALCDRLEAAQQQREQERTRLSAAAWQGVVAEPAAAPARFALEQLPALTTRPEQVKALRQTILDLAVRGRLVEQNEGDEPAGVLLEKMDAERAERVARREFRKTQPLPSVEVDEQTVQTPAGWAWTRFGVIGDWGSGSTPSRSIGEYYSGSYTWLKSGELNDIIGLTGSEEKVTERALKECSFRLNHKGDVLIAMYGATIGKLAILGEDAVTNQAVCGCTVLSGMLNKYLFLQLLAMRSAFHGQSEGGAQPNISKEKIVNTPFPLPPLAEQRRIVAKVEELMALCDGLEAALQEGEELKAKALEAVVRSDDEIIRRSDNGVPAKRAQKAVKHMPRYVEAEVELAVAAEPAVHPGALQAAVRRGPGRPPKNGASTITVARAIEEFLRAHPGWHGKSAILAATGTDAAAWNAAIKELLEGGQVDRQGEKKGARYKAAE